MGSGYGNWPNYNGFITQCWGSPSIEYAGGFSLLNGASNIVVGTNPAYSISDFIAFFPKFAGPPAVVTGTLTQGSAVVTGIVVPTPSTANPCYAAPVIAVGQLITGGGIPANTTILSVTAGSPLSLTMSQPATSGGTTQISIYTAPLAPIFVINTYIAVASASLVQARWLELWMSAMAFYVAHLTTLYLRSEGSSQTTPAAASVAGLKVGVTVSSSAGGVSQSLQLPAGLDDWSGWTQTTYGIQLSTWAKGVGAGPSLCY